MAIRDGKPRISLLGYVCPSVEVFLRSKTKYKEIEGRGGHSALKRPWGYWADVMWVSCGTKKPKRGQWARRNGTDYFKFEVCDSGTLSPTKRLPAKRRFGA